MKLLLKKCAGCRSHCNHRESKSETSSRSTLAEATAKHVVSVAKTFAREDDSKALQEMAVCPDKDAERALQRILKKYDLTLNVPRTNVIYAPNCTVPVLLPEDYIRVLSEKGYLHKLLGGPLHNRAFVSNLLDPSKHPPLDLGLHGLGLGGPMYT